MQTLRDWRYSAPLATLVAITAIAAVLAGSNHGPASADVTLNATPATATPAPTPDLGAVLRDSRRQLDLAALAFALEGYHARNGSYPTTSSAFRTACSDPSDPLCVLKVPGSNLGFSDGLRPYEYQSDGASYTLFTEIGATGTSEACPAELPPDLAGQTVFCVSSRDRER